MLSCKAIQDLNHDEYRVRISDGTEICSIVTTKGMPYKNS